MATTLRRRIVRAGGWGLAKRLIKPIPIIGSLFAVALAGYEIKKKGLVPGVVHVGLDVTPILGTAKNVVEIFTGDWIPDKPVRNSAPTNTIQQPATQEVANTIRESARDDTQNSRVG